MVANYLESGSEDQQKSSLSAAASATYGAGGGDAPAPAPAPGGDGGGGIEGPSVTASVNFGSSQETATKKGLKDVSVSFACTGGDPSICKNKNAGTQKYLDSIKDNPEMFESSVVPISRAVPSDLRNEARQQIDLFFKELGEQCPTKVAGKICSGNGMCMTNKDWAPAALSTSGAKCHCNAGQTGNACELKMVGTLEPRWAVCSVLKCCFYCGTHAAQDSWHHLGRALRKLISFMSLSKSPSHAGRSRPSGRFVSFRDEQLALSHVSTILCVTALQLA